MFPGTAICSGSYPSAGSQAMIVAVPVGLVALRVRRHTFVVITIAIFFVFQLSAINFGFTGGTAGLQLPLIPWLENQLQQAVLLRRTRHRGLRHVVVSRGSTFAIRFATPRYSR